jgi:hypothetical protein
MKLLSRQRNLSLEIAPVGLVDIAALQILAQNSIKGRKHYGSSSKERNIKLFYETYAV